MSAYDTVVLADSPVGYWPLHETTGTTVADLSGNGLTGTWVGTPVLGQAPIDSGLGTSVAFYDGQIEVPHNSLFDFASGSYTLECWLKFNSTSGFQEFITKGFGTSYRLLMSAGGNPQFYISSPELSAASAMGVNAPNYLVLVVDSVANTSTMWLNGTLIGTGTYANGSGDTTSALVFGALLGGTNQYVGDGSNFAVYNYALSSARIAAHYAAGIAIANIVIPHASNPTPISALGGSSVQVNRAPESGNPFIPSNPIPNVVGLSDAAAQALIISDGFAVGTITSVSSAEPIGQVLGQTPPAGTSELPGTHVDLVESLGLVVPNVVNTSLTVVATPEIIAAGFVVGVVTYETSGTIIAGNIIRQFPAAGTIAAGGSGINVVVSTGLPALTVPDLFGLSQTDAINLLLSLGLVPGAIGSAPSKFVPPGLIQTQNPSPGAAVAVGTIVSFVLSLGIPAVGTQFDFEATVISQYANSPTILQLCNNLNQYIDQSTNFANFYNFVWNVDTAVGFGLDIWGKIVNVSRLLQIPNSTKYVGFFIDGESQPAQDWTPAGSSQAPYNKPPVGGAFYSGNNATDAYLLSDDAYRQLILAKAFANICTTTAPAINQILQNLYGPGAAWVLNDGPMAISYNLSFTPTAIQLAILEQSGVIPTPPGVSVTINTNV